MVERGAVTKSQKGRKASVERKVGECYQWKAIGQCSKGDSCSFSHDPASGNRRHQRQEGQSSSPVHQKRRHRLTGRYPQKVQAAEERVLLEQGVRFRADIPLGKCTSLSCNYWRPPVCLYYKCESGCTYGEKCRFRHVEADGLSSKQPKKSGAKGQLPY